MEIKAAQVRELRERTGAGMMECKRYLVESGGDIELAIDNMRKKGAAKAAKKEGRVTAEGIIIVATSADRRSAVIVEINCETDFVGRGDDFKAFAEQVAARALAIKAVDVASIANIAYAEGSDKTVEQVRQELVAKIGENIQIRRVTFMESNGEIGSYIHGGRIGVLVDLNVANTELSKDLAMHIAASQPVVVNADDVPADMLEKEKEIFMAQAKESGKPDDIIEKMIHGRMKKYVDEISLMGQAFVKDPNKKISQLVKEANAEVVNFVRYEVGEGIEKQEENFADEVMAQVRGSE